MTAAGRPGPAGLAWAGILLAFSALGAAAAAPIPAAPPAAPAGLDVDCSGALGEFRPRALGFINVYRRVGSINHPGSPDSALFWGLQPSHLRLDPNRALENATIRGQLRMHPGTRLQVILIQDGNFPKRRIGGRPNPKYDSLVRNEIRNALAAMDSAEALYGNYRTRRVAWDVINEPNIHPLVEREGGEERKRWLTQDTALDNDFFDYWKRMVRAIKAQDPAAVVVGPSINNFVPTFLDPFLRAARDSAVLPDLLSWHELAQNWERPGDIPAHVEEMRRLMRAAGIDPPLPISINEYGDMGPNGVLLDSLAPGYEVHWFAAFERAGVESAMRSCWAEVDGGLPCEEGTILGLLTNAPGRQKPRSVYHAYRAYASLKGRSLSVRPGAAGMDGLAVHDREAGILRILVGRYKSPGTVSKLPIRIRRLDALGFGKSVKVTARRIGHSWRKESGKGAPSVERVATVSGGELSLRLPDFGPFDAYSIEISPAR